MASRLELHDEFIDILGTRDDSESRVYFQPPPSLLMKYEAIRYELSGKDIKRANNNIYQNMNEYAGVVITRDPDSPTLNTILEHFQYCSFGRPYIAENLYHFPFTLYY
jgi:hypothetical protein